MMKSWLKKKKKKGLNYLQALNAVYLHEQPNMLL